MNECKTCNRRFHDASNLKVHEKTHIGLKPFQCKICGKCFSQTSNLKSHEITHTVKKTL